MDLAMAMGVALFGMFAGVPVWVTPGVVDRVDLTAPPQAVRSVRGASASIVDLGGPASPMVHLLHARDPRAGETVNELSSEDLAKALANLA